MSSVFLVGYLFCGTVWGKWVTGARTQFWPLECKYSTSTEWVLISVHFDAILERRRNGTDRLTGWLQVPLHVWLKVIFLSATHPICLFSLLQLSLIYSTFHFLCTYVLIISITISHVLPCFYMPMTASYLSLFFVISFQFPFLSSAIPSFHIISYFLLTRSHQ